MRQKQLICWLFILPQLLVGTALTQTATEKWRFTAQGPIITAPALGADGTVYFGSLDNSFYAVNPDGTQKWAFDTGDAIGASPAISSDGSIYFAGSNQIFYALNPDGTIKWQFRLDYFAQNAPAIGIDGTIYVSADKLYAIDPDGNLKWTSKSKASDLSSPIIGHDGTIYVASDRLSALSPNGKLKWSVPFSNGTINREASCSPAIGPDGTIFIGTKGANLWAIESDGTVKWRFQTGSWIMSSPVIDNNGRVYFGSNETKFYILNPDGSKRHEVPFESRVSPSCLGQGGTVYFSSNRDLVALDSNGSIKWRVSIHSNRRSAPVIAFDGTLYIGTSGGESGGDSNSYLFAFQTESLGLANNVWAKFMRDDRNSGNAFDPNVPVAKVQQDTLMIAIGESIFLDGSPSLNPSGNPLSYLWTCVEKPVGSEVTIENSKKSIASVTLHDRGLYIFQLKVWDQLNVPSVEVVFVQSGFREMTTIGYIAGSPALGLDGTIYTGSRDDRLYAFNPDGSKKWEFVTAGIVSTPSVGPDGTIYIGSVDQTFYAVNPDGTQKWFFPMGGSVLNSAAIDANGTIYIDSGDFLYAISSDGQELWKYEGETSFSATAAIGSDGTIYAIDNDGTLHAFYSDGNVKWEHAFNERLRGRRHAPVIDRDETIYMTISGGLQAFYPDGSKKWFYKEDDFVRGGSPAIDANGTLYVNSKDEILALNPDGTFKWRHRAGEMRSAPAIGADGAIYAVTYGNTSNLYALSSEGVLNWLFEVGSQSEASPAIDGNGVIYVAAGSVDNRLIAIDTDSQSLASGQWPKFGLNNQNTASLHNLNAPVARIAQDTVEVELGSPVQLDGSSSSDPDGDRLFYLWRCIKKPQDSVVSITDSTVVAPEVSFSYPGYYRFSLTVTDKEDGTNVDYLVVKHGVKWSRQFLSPVLMPTIGARNEIIVSVPHSGIFALAENGQLLWHFEAGTQDITSAAIAADSSIFVSIDNRLVALHNDGSERWSFRSSRGRFLQPAISAQGTIYVGAHFDDRFYAINPDGTLRWSILLEDNVGSPLAIGTNGTIYFTSSAKYLNAMSPYGRIQWKFATDEVSALSPPAIGMDGTIYFGSGFQDGKLYAVKPDGTARWKFEVDSSISGSPVLGADGTIYFASRNNIYAISPNGQLVWSFPTAGGISASPIVDSEGMIYVGSRDKKFYALDSDGTLSWQWSFRGEILHSAALNSDGVLYFGSTMMHAVETVEKGQEENTK